MAVVAFSSAKFVLLSLCFLSTSQHRAHHVTAFSTLTTSRVPHSLQRERGKTVLLARKGRKKNTNSLDDDDIQDRRKMLASSFATVAAFITVADTQQSANAFEKAYPIELTAVDGEKSGVDSRARKVNQIRNQELQRSSDAKPLTGTPVLSSVVWAGALWLLSGSRSNPIATPLANAIYNQSQEEWLQDRNAGLFASLPWEFLVIIAFVFVGLGYGTDTLVTAVAEGDRTISLQLAGVSLIAGGSLELGRIFSGEKKQTREESDRVTELVAEFEIFATNRLRPGGNCHRNEVVQAFRRYYAKYRQHDSEEYPLTDLEIEKLLRAYCRARGLEMSSAGFYSGIQINQDADIFVAN